MKLHSARPALAAALGAATLAACGAPPASEGATPPPPAPPPPAEAAPTPAPAPPPPEPTPAPTLSFEPATPAADGSLGAPLIEGVTWRLGADRAGALVEMAPGERFQVELVGVPTAGYLWKAVEAPAFVRGVGEAGGPTAAAQSEPGFTGGNHWEVFAFDVVGEGEGVVRFAQARPWETNEPPAATFEFVVRSRIPG